VIALLTLAEEARPNGLWNPTILGVLVFAAGLVLFCGSVYLLLGTNLGGRLGFLVSASGLMGLLTLLALLWLTTSTPLNSPHGRQAMWHPKEVADLPSEARTRTVRHIEQAGRHKEHTELAVIQPAVLEALLTQAPVEGKAPSPFAIPTATKSNDIILKNAWEIGGASRAVFWHKPLYQVVQFCQDDNSDDPPETSTQVEPPPKCDASIGDKFIVFEYDYGSLRLPPAMYLVAFAALFALSLLGLHWRELDQRRLAARSTTPATTGT
jgi:hypothetical protein